MTHHFLYTPYPGKFWIRASQTAKNTKCLLKDDDFCRFCVHLNNRLKLIENVLLDNFLRERLHLFGKRWFVVKLYYLHVSFKYVYFFRFSISTSLYSPIGSLDFFFLIISSMPNIHLFLGLPTVFLPGRFHLCVSFGALVLSHGHKA